MVLPEKDDGVRVGYTTEDERSMLAVSHRYRNDPVKLCLLGKPPHEIAYVAALQRSTQSGTHSSSKSEAPRRSLNSPIPPKGQLPSAGRFNESKLSPRCMSPGDRIASRTIAQTHRDVDPPPGLRSEQILRAPPMMMMMKFGTGRCLLKPLDAPYQHKSEAWVSRTEPREISTCLESHVVKTFRCISVSCLRRSPLDRKQEADVVVLEIWVHHWAWYDGRWPHDCGCRRGRALQRPGICQIPPSWLDDIRAFCVTAVSGTSVGSLSNCQQYS